MAAPRSSIPPVAVRPWSVSSGWTEDSRISFKTLSATLKELEADGLVHREEYPQIPPKVEYSLTERGRSLIPILDQMCTWGEEHRRP